MSFRRLVSAVRSAREALARGAPLADGLLKSLLSVIVIFCIAVSSPPAASAKPFAFSFPAGWSLAGLVGGVGARSDEPERREPAAGVKPYTGRRVGNDTLRMIYHHDQTVAVVELGPGKLLLNCELIETYDEYDTSRLLRQLSRINRPLGVTFPQMIKLMSQCQQVAGVESSDEAKEAGGEGGGWRAEGAARARLDAGGAHAGLLGGSPLTLLQGIIPGTKWCGTGDIAADYHDLGADRRLDRCCRTHDLCPTKVAGVESSDEAKEAGGEGGGWRAEGAARARLDAGGAHAGLLGGSPLTLLQGIIPGTKWCGTGDIAADYHDLGADRRLDRCCRTHDLCPTKVRAFSQRYNLTNNSLYSKSHCTCDDMLFDCLKATNTSASHLMGHIYFNIVQVPCLADRPAGNRHFRDAKLGF